MVADRSRAGTVPLVAGRPVLDLVNTISWRGDPARAQDHLLAPDDALTWAQRAGALTPTEAPVLRRHLEDRRAAGAGFLTGLHDLRSLVADTVLAPPRPRTGDVEPVLIEALAHSHLTTAPEARAGGAGEHTGGPHRWQVTDLDEHTVRRRLALDLLDLLTTPHGRLGRCADLACFWVFLDTSRAQNRQWCASSDCGNRHRVRQHHQRRITPTAAPAGDP